MSLVRLIVLVGVIISLVAVTLQNQTPMITLVFLGQQLQPLPLGVLVVGAIAIGIATGLILLLLLNLSGKRGRQPVRSRQRRSTVWEEASTPEPDVGSDWGNPASAEPPPSSPNWDTGSAPKSVENSSDWDARSSDWDSPPSDWGANPADWRSPSGNNQTQSPPPPTFFREQPKGTEDVISRRDRSPKQQEQPSQQNKDSTYSYHARDAKFSGSASQREFIYDAEYRVLTPPYKQESNNEDWNEFDDEFSEDDSPR